MHGNKKDARERLQKEPVLLTFVLDSGLWNCEKMHSCTSLWNFAMGMLASGQCGSGGEWTARLPSRRGREWTCLRQGTELQEEGARGRLLLKTRPDDDWGPAEDCTSQAPDSDLSSPFKSPHFSGVLCACLHSLVWGLGRPCQWWKKEA